MADNITYSGSGSSVPANTVQRTDDLGAAGHVPYVKIMDGTDGASSPAKVTAEGNLQAITPNRTASGTLDANDEAVTISTTGMGTVVVQVTAYTLDSSAELVAEGSADGGTTWTGLYGRGSSIPIQGLMGTAQGLAAGQSFTFSSSAYTSSRFRLTNRSSGAITISVEASAVAPTDLWVGLAGGDGATAEIGGGIEAAALRVTVASDSTGVLSVDDNGGSLTVDGSVALAAGAEVKITDGTDDVAVTSEGNLQTITPNRTATATINADEEAVTISSEGAATVSFVVTASNLIADVMYEATPDGVTWVPVQYWAYGALNNAGAADSLTVNDIKVIPAQPFTSVRARIDAYTSGSATVTAVANIGAPSLNAVNIFGASGLPIPGDDVDGMLVNLGANNDVTVTGVATAANQTTELASLAAIESDADAIRVATQKIDDPVQVLGTDTYAEATSSGMTMGAVRRDADTTLVGTTNEFGPLQMDANGRLKVEAFSGETLPVSLTSTTVTGTVAVTQSGTWDEVGINDSGNSITVDAADGTVFVRSTAASTFPVDIGRYGGEVVPTLGTGTYTEATSRGIVVAGVRRDADTTAVGTDNEYTPFTVDANGRLKVEAFDGGDSHTVDQATAANLNAQVVGNIAHDTAHTGNPVTVSGTHETIADSAPANRLASVTDGDVQRLSTTDGALFVIPTGPQSWKARLTGAMSDTTVKAAPASGLSLYITDIVYSIGSASASSILLEESTTTAVFGPHYLEAIAGRGLAVHLGTPIKITAATLLSATSTGSTTNTLDVYGFTAPG